MNSTAEQTLNRRLSDEADVYLDMIEKDTSGEMTVRESAFHRDSRPLGHISPYDKKLDKLHRAGSMRVNEYAIAASFYRDVRVYAASKGLFGLFRFAFFREHLFRCRMLLAAPELRDKCLGAFYMLWGLSSRYGTSLQRWLLSGAAMMALFAFLLMCVGNESFGLSSLSSAFLCSIETFSQAAYDVESKALVLRLTLLAARLVGMVYLAFGFGLLLPRLSLELSRATPSTQRDTVP